MEIFKLNSSYYPSDTIPIFKSFIWTERYTEAGDFELTMEDDISILNLLPLGTLISHTDTTEVMIVENHELQRDKDKKLIVTVTGRSLETFCENRTTTGSDSPVTDGADPPVTLVETLSSMPSCEAAVHIMKYKLQSGFASASDAVPNLVIEEDVTTHDSAMVHTIKRGDIYSRVLEFLKMSKTGIKTARPISPVTNLKIIVHDGTDLSDTIAFYAQYEDLEDAKYFKSIQGYKNYARVSAHTVTRLYRHRDLASDLTGLNRRVIYEEANDLEGAFSPPSSSDSIASRGQAALDKHKQISLFQAKISVTAKPKFKFDYNVGDIVTVFGEFSTPEKMRVTEHILTVDEKGIIGYPSLSSIT